MKKISNRIELIYLLNGMKNGYAIFGYGKLGSMLQSELQAIGTDDFVFCCTDESFKTKDRHRGVSIYSLEDLDKGTLVFIFEQSPFAEDMIRKCVDMDLEYAIVTTAYCFGETKEQRIDRLIRDVELIKIKLATDDNVWQRGGTKFYLPKMTNDVAPLSA